MTALHDRSGSVVGYVAEDWLLDRRGRAVGMIADKAVWNERGRCVGWWQGDNLIGLDGGLIAFVRGARNLGVQLPIAAAAGRTPETSPPADRWPTSSPPDRPVPRMVWSKTVYAAW
jgi:hypothetical protein